MFEHTPKRRKTTVEKLQFYLSNYEALLVLPDSEFKLAHTYIADVFRAIRNHDSPRSSHELEESVKQIPNGISNAGKRIVRQTIEDIYQDIADYWRKADQNAKNRAQQLNE